MYTIEFQTRIENGTIRIPEEHTVRLREQGVGQAVRVILYVPGQEFDVDGNKPEGFCVWAWNDLFKSLSVLHFGGNLPWAEEGKMIACCTDGIRPVSFKLERID